MNNGFSNWSWDGAWESLGVGIGLFLIGIVCTIPYVVKNSELEFFKKLRKTDEVRT